jgi:hypothetical protein
MEDLDLNLDNYELEDLLSLFKLPYNFNEEQLKSAKKLVLQTHPDKSKLPQEYFFFFSAAYKMLFGVHNFRTKSDCTKNTTYTVEKDEEKAWLLKDISKNQNFNKIFNELFEKHHLKSEATENGYGDWLKSEDDIDNRIATKDNMGSMFEQKKHETKSLIVHQGIQDFSGGGQAYQNLLDEKPTHYSSDVFSSLPYEDLRKAHQESVIPVTQEDFDMKPKFGSVNEMQMTRDSQDTKPKSLLQATEYLDHRKDMEDKQSTQRAYKLMQQDEEVKKLNNSWMSRFKQLTET